MLAYKTVSGTKSFKKLVHLVLQFLAFCSSIVGLWAAWKFHNDKGIDNFYSLHSWLGLACLFLFGIQVLLCFSVIFIFMFLPSFSRIFSSKLFLKSAAAFFSGDLNSQGDPRPYCLNCWFAFFAQWAVGFATFWFPGGSRNGRAKLLPWHVFFGVYIYALAVAACATGILEKATFLQTNQVISRYSREALLVNSMGILIVILGGFVILAIVSPTNGKTDFVRETAE